MVVRPVGHTGKLVQVLEANTIPVIVDAKDLFSSPEWTGLALVPSRPNWPARILGGVSAIAAVGLVSSWLERKWGKGKRKKRVGDAIA